MSAGAISVTRELYLPAPAGIAVYAQNPCYCAVRGERLVESVKHGALHFDRHGHKVYYHPRIWRRFSDDNGGLPALPRQAGLSAGMRTAA